MGSCQTICFIPTIQIWTVGRCDTVNIMCILEVDFICPSTVLEE